MFESLPSVMVVSCLGLRNDDSMVFICVTWCMVHWSTKECSGSALGLVTDHMVSDHMLISILSMSVEPRKMLCTEAVIESLASDV